ncbi:MAG: SusC/RagA family TonB-linked outer membrane protein [Flaviaesturariibacter sp.]|nr:SusC/RagA family TonB-linked outer membrane protein [Flaviaesturariibacter sp.]
MLMLFCVLAFAQTRTISGTVRDAQGNPVPFATVTEAGTRNAVQADANGNYSIKVGANARLDISATGYAAVSGSSGGAVTMTRTEGTLSEVVVTTAAGIKRQKKELGYSTTTVSAKDLTVGKATNIGSALSGKVAGLNVVQPNSSVTNDVRITLRGNRSISGNNQPILVVDGSILSISYLNQLNPNDVDNVTVLKGAAASSLYGNEASNGAIVITTKKGSRSAPVINLSSTVNVESISLMPELQEEYGSYGGEGLDAQGRSTYIPYENQSYGPRYNGQMVPLGNPVVTFNAATGKFDTSTFMVPYRAVKNGKRKFFDNSITFQNNVSFSSGDAGGQFYVSAENMRKSGTVPDDKATRNSVRLNASKEIRKVTLSANIEYAKSTYNIVGPDVNQDRSVYWSILNAPAHAPIADLSDIVNNPYATPSGYFNAYYGNPWWTIKNSRQIDDRDNIISNARLEFRPLDWLSLSYQVNYNAFFDKYEYHRNSIKYTEGGKYYAEHGFDIYPASGGYKSSSFPGVAQTGYRERFNYSRLQGDFLLNLHKNFNKISSTLLLGQTTYQITQDRNDLGYDPQTGTINTYGDISVWGPAYATGGSVSYHNESKQRTIGAFADLTLGYNNYLFLHGSVRNDWDSRLEKENRSFLYPSLDASILFSEAIPAVKNFAPLTSGKLRVSYARVGQLNLGAYSTRDFFTSPAGFPFGTIGGYSVGGTFNNPNIEPEFTTEKEVGVELAWLKNRLLTDFSVFRQNTTNQTLNLGISPATGRGTAVLNIGEVQNSGVEADIKGTIIQKRNLRWMVGVNYSYIKNKVLEIAPGVDQQALNTTTGGLGGGVYAVVGQSYPTLRTTDWVRDSMGRIIVDRNTGLPTKNAALTSYGTTQPPHRLGLNTSLAVGHFTVAATAEFRGGAVMLNAVGSDLDFTGVSKNSTKFNRERFVIPNSSYDDGTGKYVANTDVVTDTDPWNFFGNIYNTVGSNYVTSSDFWKIREVSIGYDVPASLVSKTRFIKAANISLVGRDLFIFKAKENMWSDPEFSNTTGNGIGITNNLQTPSTRKYGVSLNLTF